MICYADCYTGISGDMMLGALIDAGVPLDYLQDRLSLIGLRGYKLDAMRVARGGIWGTLVTVEEIPSDTQPLRNYFDIRCIIDSSNLPNSVKTKALHVFEVLARAEAKIHGTELDKVRFHEVGALDTIVDVVGTVIGLDYFNVKRLYVSEIPLGSGYVKTEHGWLPAPAPAALELLRGFQVWSGPVGGELVTPTGAAIIAALASKERMSQFPFQVEHVGRGAGRRELPVPNLLTLFIGHDAGS